MAPSEVKRLALLMAKTCVRNTVIEDYHSEGKLTDAEMKALNQKVANKIYTFLHYSSHGTPEEREAFRNAMNLSYPSNWDQPQLDSEFVKAVKLMKTSR